MTRPKFLIVNADDFGLSTGVNRGIIECHRRGIVTSASLMVTGSAVAQALELYQESSNLSLGLHFDVWGEDERQFDIRNSNAVRSEWHRQVEEFHRLVGRPPTHVDSHRHVHREEHLLPLFMELVEPLGIPLRGVGDVAFVGGFYAQWQWQVTNLEYVGIPFLEKVLREEIGEGWTELSCHPGYKTAGFDSVYDFEREEEILTLTSPSVRQVVDELCIRLVSYTDHAQTRVEQGS